MKIFDADETRMIGLPYGEKNYDNMLSRFHPIPERHGQDGQTDRQTDRIAISLSRVSVLTRYKNLLKILASTYTVDHATRHVSRTTFWFVDTHRQTDRQTRRKQYQFSLSWLVADKVQFFSRIRFSSNAPKLGGVATTAWLTPQATKHVNH